MRFSDRQRAFAQAIVEGGKRYYIASGGKRCGKSESGIAGTCQRAARHHGGKAGLLLARRQSLMDDVVIGKINAWADRNGLPKLARVPNKAKQWQMPALNGQPVRFVEVLGTDSTEQAAKNIQGIDAAFAYIDEIALMPQSLVNMVTGSMLAEPDAVIVGTCNPDHPQHWLRQEYILPILDDDKPDMTGEYFEFQLSDNPNMTAKGIRELTAGWPPTFFRRMALGKWVAGDMTVFNLADDNTGTIPDDALVQSWYCALDFGVTFSYAMLTARCADRSYVTAELVLDLRDSSPMLVSEQADAIYRWATRICGSVTGWVVPFDAHGMTEWLLSNAAGNVYQAFQPQADGVAFANQHIEGFEGRPKVVVDRAACPRLSQEIYDLKFKESLLAKGTEAIDKTTADGGHATDAFRYQFATLEAKARNIGYERQL
ncbi:MAG: terminase family protein [Acidobacteria bacterium]|nr:terminase family protein [Acidobacteriota bacterium]